MELWCIFGSCEGEEDGEGCLTAGMARGMGQGRIMTYENNDVN